MLFESTALHEYPLAPADTVEKLEKQKKEAFNVELARTLAFKAEEEKYKARLLEVLEHIEQEARSGNRSSEYSFETKSQRSYVADALLAKGFVVLVVVFRWWMDSSKKICIIVSW